MYYVKTAPQHKHHTPMATIYPHQHEVALDIVDSFCNNEVLLATLIAPPQWGKTGVVMDVIGLMITNGQLQPSNIFVCTGMSDLSWKVQTKDRILVGLKNNVFHRNDIKKLVAKLFDKKDCLVVLDECHIATESKQQFSRLIHESGLLDIAQLKEKNIHLLQTSATPVHTLVDASMWGHLHQLFIATCPPEYVGFDTLLANDRVKRPFDLTDEEEVQAMLTGIVSVWPMPKYHIVRLNLRKSNKELECVRKVALASNFSVINHNSKCRVEDIDDLFMLAPPQHTIIFIKGFWRASKTFVDTHIGLCHETTGKTKDFNAEVQGLAGRLCGYKTHPYHGPPPIVCCNQSILKEYIAWFCKKCDYRTVRYRSASLRASKGNVSAKTSLLHPEKVANMPELPSDVQLVAWRPEDVVGYIYTDYSVSDFLAMAGLEKFPSTPNELCYMLQNKFGVYTNVVYVREDSCDGSFHSFPRSQMQCDIYCFPCIVRMMHKA